MKIYTKTGDGGMTGLFSGPRVPKDHPRIQAYGAVDELNAALGVVEATISEAASDSRSEQMERPALSEISTELRQIQSDLFSIGAQLATPDPEAHQMCLLKLNRVEALEGLIDRFEDQLEPLKSFILPGGSSAAALLHVARTICRRAERDVVALAHEPEVDHCEPLLIYLNRLSDLLFVWARAANHAQGVPDLPWTRAD